MTVAAGLEAVTFDGLELNDDTNLGLASFDPGTPRQRAEWVGSADSEFQTLFRDPLYENRELTCRVQVVPQSTTDAALDKLNQIRDKLAEASKREDGLTLTWRPADSNRTVTFAVLAGEITDMPIDWEGGWLVKAPSVTIRMVAKPEYEMTPFATVTDAFGTNSIADYTFDAGAAGNVSITGGVMDAVANLTTENRLYHSTSPYPVTDSQVTVKHTLGTTLTSYKAGVILKRTSANDYLIVYVDDTGAASRLRIDRVIGGATTNLVTTALTRMTVSTAYWVRGRLEGNVVVGEHWTAAPTATGTAATANTATLAGADATAFGVGVSGRAGLVWTPQQTAASLDDLEIAPHVAVSNSSPVTTMVIPDVAGDLGGKVKLTVQNRSSTDPIRHFEWGGEQRYYSASSPVPLVIDSDSLVTSGFAGAGATRAGAYDPDASGNSVIRATVTGTPTAICGTGSLSHVGRFRIAARVWTSSSQIRVRLVWRSGDGGYMSLPWTAPAVTSAFARAALGTIDPQAAVIGAQAWEGRIEAYTLDGSMQTVDVDLLHLMPTGEGYGLSRAAFAYQSGAITSADNFDSIVNNAALNGRTATIGGTWATSGVAGDFKGLVSGSVGMLYRDVTITEASARHALLGTTTYTDTDVTVLGPVNNGASSVDYRAGFLARYVDTSNMVRAYWENAADKLVIEVIVAGVTTTYSKTVSFGNRAGFTTTPTTRHRFVAWTSGTATLRIEEPGGQLLADLWITDSRLATGGALASGKVGLMDQFLSGTSLFRVWEDFAAGIAVSEPIVIHTGRSLRITSDDTRRESSAGGTWGLEQSYRGARPLIPAAGTRDLTTRLAVFCHANDLAVSAWEPDTAGYSVQTGFTPRGLVVPRG